MPPFPDEIIPLRDYLNAGATPLIIAGPCSAETEEQVVQTARELARQPQVVAFRCGIWKPRTRPGDFEGKGEEALTWLERAKEETRLPICVEVALPVHIKACLEHNVDILWIGSRTVVNPFSINEIAEALKGVDIPVMVKNPVNPDLLLWIGALERLHQQGIRKLSAIHRGFSAYGSRPYRNMPFWEIPIELRRQFPELPVMVDPSHICGNRDLLRQVSQTALNLAFDGLMIEAHISPENALSDREQQLSPGDLKDMVTKLVIPSVGYTNNEELSRLRSEIDHVDEQVLILLARRMELASRIGDVKRGLGMDYLQMERWKEVVEDRLAKGSDLGLNRDFLMHLLRLLHEEALRIQSEEED